MPTKMMPLSLIDDRIREIDQDLQALHDLQTERAMLVRLKNRAENASSASAKDRNVGKVRVVGSGRPTIIVRKKPSRAVFDYVSKHPGSRATEIADAVADTISTKSSDRRRLVINTAANMVNRGQLVREDGCYWVKENGTGSE